MNEDDEKSIQANLLCTKQAFYNPRIYIIVHYGDNVFLSLPYIQHFIMKPFLSPVTSPIPTILQIRDT